MNNVSQLRVYLVWMNGNYNIIGLKSVICILILSRKVCECVFGISVMITQNYPYYEYVSYHWIGFRMVTKVFDVRLLKCVKHNNKV